MRLTLLEKEALVTALTPFLNGIVAQLRLYGSRLKDDLKGGDLDLLLLVEDKGTADALAMKKHYLLSAIKKHLGERKVDLIIASQETMASHTFLTMIYPESIVLFTWPPKA